MSEKAILDMAEAAKFLGIDYATMCAYVKAGLIAAVRYPSLVKSKRGRPRRKKLFRRETLERFIIENEITDSGTKVGTKPLVPTARNYEKGWHERVLAKSSK